ncbi:tetratricopeptide repeat protein, partial [Acinetobacter baumannii]
VSLAALAGFQRQLSRKLAENPLDLATAWRLAEIGRAAGDLDAAIRAYRACLMLEPGNPAARQLLATLEGQMLPRDEADAG